MNLCFSTLGCPDWSFERVVSEAQRMGYSAIEVRGIGDVLRIEQIEAFKPENQQRTQSLLDKAGIRIVSLNTSATLQDPATLQDALDEVKSALAVANRMGIAGIRVFGDARPVDGATPLPMQHVADGLEAMCGIAAQMGSTQIWLEIHGAINSKERLVPILQQVGGHPSFGLIWDIQHSYRAAGNDIIPFYELVRPFVKHMHIKDGREIPGDFEITLLGEGNIDIPQIVNRLEQDGYDGCYSFEWEKRWHRNLPEPELAFPAYVHYMRTLAQNAEPTSPRL